MDFLKSMNSVLDYIEDNLDGEITDDKIAVLSANSKGVFQRIFTAITDMTLSEYIRKRRLTQAAVDIQNTDMKIIDIAVKYGYNSADAFSSAFKSFHGITPSDARTSKIEFQHFYPFNFKFMLSVKGGNDMEYRIIKNAESTVAQFDNAAETVAANASKSAREICEISAMMNEMAAIVVNNHKNAQTAIQIALEIAKSAEEISQIQKLADEITATKEKQSDCIKQINTVIANMEKDVQSNAVTSMELQKSTQGLKELVDELDKT